MLDNTASNNNETGVFKLTLSWLKGWKGIWTLSAGIYAVVYSSWLFFKWTDPAYETLIGGLAYIPLGIFSAVCAGFTANQKQLDRGIRRAWTLIAISIVSLVMGDMVYTILENTKGIGFPDIPDIFYLLFYPLAFTGLVIMPTRIHDQSQEKTWKLDLAVMIVSTTAVLWYFIVQPTAIAKGDDWSATVFAGAYPVMDMLLLSSIASILFRHSGINTRRSLYILAVALLWFIVADIIYAWQVLEGSYVTGNWVDILWTLSYFLIGLAALRQSSLHLNETESVVGPFMNRQSVLASFVPLSASVAVSLYASGTGDGAGMRTNGLITGTAIAIFLTIIRQTITVRENSRLLDELNLASDQLRANAKILEERVIERTKDLEGQTNRLRIAAQIAKDATFAKDMEALLDRSATLILNRLNLYHVAIYLLDQKREYAILTASPTEAGRQMIANGHKLRVGEPDIVGRVAATGEPRITLERDQDAGYSQNPLLPNTRSEMAMPLKVEARTVGVLDVQSDQPQAFNEDDIAVMQILADQLAIAIERTQLLQQVEENARELQQAYSRSTHESWKSLAESGLLSNKGYRFDNVRIQPIHSTPELGAEAMASGKLIIKNLNENSRQRQAQVAIPVKLRGQTIGVVSVKLKEGYNRNTINTIKQAVERLAASLESARLFEEARSRADREQAISQVTSAISSAPDFDAILRTTAEEIGRSLGDSEVSIRLAENLE